MFYNITYTDIEERYAVTTNTINFRRGFTGHEHWNELGLIDMSGRFYDPLLARFLSPDPYIQAPYDLQNFNRYSYCLNNPLKYTDPSGYKWKWWQGVLASLFVPVASPTTMTTMAVDFTRTTLFRGGLDVTSVSSMKNAWSNFDPSQNGSWTQNAWDIDMGLYQTDQNESFGRRTWQFISRFTWESLQTSVGWSYSQICNATGTVDRVDYFGGATFCTNENSSKSSGVTLGNYIWINNYKKIDNDFDSYLKGNATYMHEFGHTIQGRRYGLAYLFSIGIPSLESAACCELELYNGYLIPSHRLKWFEREASAYARDYFGEKYWSEDIEKYHPTYGF